MVRTLFRALLIGAFLITSLAPLPLQAEEFLLPAPGAMVHLSPPLNPPILKGLKVHTENPFRFDFILDKGDSNQNNDQLKQESTKLIKYFLASLTIPEKDLWVNLSPYEKDRIVPESFGLTEMGRDLLAQDYMLKQITASLIYPEDEIGKKFWDRIYEEAQAKYHTTDIPVNTFNKVWIVPEKAVVYENAEAGTAYVVESRLKVMLEQDYLSLEKHEGLDASSLKSAAQNDVSALGSQIVREIVIPELEREVNEGKNFSQLRQVYNSLILATWYKKKIKDSLLAQVYSDKNKTEGINTDDPEEKQKIYQQYLQAFKKGVYNYIKEDIDPVTQEEIPRKYFSGGMQFTTLNLEKNMVMTSDAAMLGDINKNNGLRIDVKIDPAMKAIPASRSNSDGYRRFGDWLRDIPQDRFENKILIIETLQTFMRVISTDNDRDVRQAAAEGLRVLIRSGYVGKEDINEGKVLENIFRFLGRETNGDVYKAIVEILSELISAGMVGEGEVVQNIKKGKSVESILENFDERNAEALLKLIDVGFVRKEEVIETLKETDFIEKFFRNLRTGGLIVRSEVRGLGILIENGLVDKEEVLQRMDKKRIIENIVNDLIKASYSREDDAEMSFGLEAGKTMLVVDDPISQVSLLNEMITVRLIDINNVAKIIRSQRAIENLLNENVDWTSRKSSSIRALKAMITMGLVTREEVERFTRDRGIREALGSISANERISTPRIAVSDPDVPEDEMGDIKTLLEDLSDVLNSDEMRTKVLGIRKLIAAGHISREEIKEKRIIEILLRYFNSKNMLVRKVGADVLSAVIAAGLMPREEKFTKDEVEAMFKDIYGRGFPSDGFLHYYLRFLAILKDNPKAAYKISAWNLEELEELFLIFDLFAKGVALDTSYKPDINQKYYLENALIKEFSGLLDNPAGFLAALKKEIKSAINDKSIKIAIRVYEMSAVNAAKGLIKALGLDKKRVVILYFKEINAQQAAEHFPGHVIQSYGAFKEEGAIQIDFHDRPGVAIRTNGSSLHVELSNIPFKFTPPKEASEEVSKLRKALGIGTRKVYVLGSLSVTEFKEFMEDYNSLYAHIENPSDRPLIIVGVREKNIEFFNHLSGQRVLTRSQLKAPLPKPEIVRESNVIMLETRGELLNWYGLATVPPIVGHERNVIEPARKGVLYFGGSWFYQKDAVERLVMAGAAQVFNRANFDALSQDPTAVQAMGENGARVVEEYRKEIEFKAMEFALDIIGREERLRNELFAPSLTKRWRVLIANRSKWSLWPTTRIWKERIDPVQINFDDQAPKAVEMEQSSGNAQTSKGYETAKGGIDFNSDKMNLQTLSEGKEIEFTMNPAILEQLKNAPGFTPVIIDIQPMTDLKIFLELANSPNLTTR